MWGLRLQKLGWPPSLLSKIWLMGNCCEYQVNYIKTHLTLILIAVYKDNQQGEQMRCFLTPFSLQTNKCMFRKAGNYHHNHSSEMTRLQDETKEESLTLMGRPSKAHIFFLVYSVCHLEKEKGSSPGRLECCLPLEEN